MSLTFERMCMNVCGQIASTIGGGSQLRCCASKSLDHILFEHLLSTAAIVALTPHLLYGKFSDVSKYTDS